MKIRLIAIGLAATVALTGASAAQAHERRGKHGKRAHAHRHRGPNSFAGSCRLSGTLEFDTPLGSDLRTTTLSDTSSGTCSGRLNGRRVHEIPVVNQVSGTATASCATGTAHTRDTLTFGGRTRIVIYTDSAFAGTQGVAHTVGAVSGHSVEHVSLLAYTDQATLEACAAGALHSARYDMEARTVTPLVG